MYSWEVTSSLGYAGDETHRERLLVLLLQGRALGFVHACCAPVVFWVLGLWLCLSSAATSGEGIFQLTDVPAESPFVSEQVSSLITFLPLKMCLSCDAWT